MIKPIIILTHSAHSVFEYFFSGGGLRDIPTLYVPTWGAHPPRPAPPENSPLVSISLENFIFVTSNMKVSFVKLSFFSCFVICFLDTNDLLLKREKLCVMSYLNVTFYSYAVVVPLTAEQKEERWQELSADLSSFLQNEEGGLPAIVNPFDPVSDVPEEDQK